MSLGLRQKIALTKLRAVLEELRDAASIPAIFEISTKKILAGGSETYGRGSGPVISSVAEPFT